MSDNPAFEDQDLNANTAHRLMWDPLYASGQVASSNAAIRGIAADVARGRVETEARALIALALDVDADGDLDPVPVTATAGTPGSFGGAGTAIPYNLAALNTAAPLPVPSTDWTTGQRVVLGNGLTAHWLADTLPATTGEADTELFSSAAHGLAIGDIVIFTALTGGTGLNTDTVYRVATDGFAAGAFKLETLAGVAVTFSTDVTGSTAITGLYYTGNAA